MNYALGDNSTLSVVTTTLSCGEYGWGADSPDLGIYDNAFTCQGEGFSIEGNPIVLVSKEAPVTATTQTPPYYAGCVSTTTTAVTTTTTTSTKAPTTTTTRYASCSNMQAEVRV